MRVEEVVGRQIRERRELAGLTQAQIGHRLAPLLGKPWSRQAVSAAEKGERAFGAAELVAFSAILNATVGDLLEPPENESAVDLGGPTAVPRHMVMAVLAATAKAREDLNLAAIQENLSNMSEAILRGQENLEEALRLARQFDGLIVQRLAAGGIVSLPMADGMTAPGSSGGDE